VPGLRADTVPSIAQCHAIRGEALASVRVGTAGVLRSEGAQVTVFRLLPDAAAGEAVYSTDDGVLLGSWP